MPTRFYIPRWDGRAAAVSTAAGSQWQQTANSFSGATARLAATTKGATAPTSTTSANFTKAVTTQPWNTLQMQAVSDTLSVAQTIAGTFSAVFRIGETTTAADVSLQVVIRVVSQNGAVQRGVLYAGHVAANNATAGALGQEAATTAATRVIPAGTALTPVGAYPGDRIVIEVGTRSTATTTGASGFLTFGDNSGTSDHALGTGNTTALVPWVELTQTLTFGTPPSTQTLPSPTTVVDDFDDNSISAAWDNWGGAQVTESSGRINLATLNAVSSYHGIERITPVDLGSGGHVSTRLVSAGNTALSTYAAYPLALVFSPNNEAYWVISNTVAYCYTTIAGVLTSRATMPFVAGAHNYFAVGLAAGQLRWLWSTNGVDWVLAFSMATPFSTDTTVQPYLMVGTESAPGSTTVMQVDDLTTWGISAAVPAEVALTPAVGSFTAVTLTATPQLVTAALSPATSTWSAQQLTPAPQPVTAALTPATATWSATATTPAPQPVTVALMAATGTRSAIALAPAAVGAATLTQATATWSARALTATPLPVAVSLVPAAASWSATALTATPGPVTVALTAAAATWTARTLTPAAVGAAALTPATTAWSAQPVTAAPGPVTTGLTPAVAAWNALPLGGAPQPSTVVLTAAPASWVPQPLTATPLPVAVALTAAVAAWSARPLTAVSGPAAVTLTAGSAAWAPRPLTAGAAPVTVTLTPVGVTWSVRPVVATAAPVTAALTPAGGAWSARPLSPAGGVATVMLQPAAAAWSAVPLIVIDPVRPGVPRPAIGRVYPIALGTIPRPFVGVVVKP